MLIKEICSLVGGVLVTGVERLEDDVKYACASDLMSDVLTLKVENFILITGLANIQAIRTVEMSDTPYLLICRGKKVSDEMLELADESGITVIRSPYSMFKCAGLLFGAGIKPVY